MNVAKVIRENIRLAAVFDPLRTPRGRKWKLCLDAESDTQALRLNPDLLLLRKEAVSICMFDAVNHRYWTC